MKTTRKACAKGAVICAAAFVASAALMNSGCGGSGASRDGGTGPGASDTIPPNVLLYSVTSDYGNTSDLFQVSPDGSGKKKLFHMPAYYQGVGLNLAVPGQKVFGYAPNGGTNPTHGIYKNNAISTSGMIQLVRPTYSFIENVQVSSDGAWVYFVAATGNGDAYLYKVSSSGGTPILLDNSSFVYTASVDIVDGSLITYDKDYTYQDGTVRSAVFVRSTASSATPRLLIDDSSANYGCPMFSPDGTKIAFVSDKDDANMEVYVTGVGGGDIQQVTAAPTISKQYTGVAFSPDGDSTAFVGYNSGVFLTGKIGSLSTPSLIVSDQTVTGGLYWTSSNGRAQVGSSATLSHPRHHGLLP